MNAQTIPTKSKIRRNTPIKIPANLLRLASGSAVAVDTNQEANVNHENQDSPYSFSDASYISS